MLSSAAAFKNAFASNLLRLVLITSLFLGSCKWQPTFDDPEKETRYRQYLAQVQLEINSYNSAVWQTSAPVVRYLKRFNVMKISENIDGVDSEISPAQVKELGAQVTALVRGANRDRDQLVRLIGLVVHRACGLTPAQLQINDLSKTQLLQYREVCAGVTAISYDSQGLESIQILLNESITLWPSAAQENEQSVDLRPYVAIMLNTKHWLNTEQLFANVQLQVWSATRQIKPVPVPDEFKDYQIKPVAMVLGEMPYRISLIDTALQTDLYGMLALEPCEVVLGHELEQLLACRQLAIHIGEHSESLETLESASQLIEKLDVQIEALKRKPEPLSPAFTQRLALLAKLGDESELLAKSGDLKTLKVRLKLLRRHGSLWLAQHLAKAKLN